LTIDCPFAGVVLVLEDGLDARCVEGLAIVTDFDAMIKLRRISGIELI
jgi:hypothetical protein